jgi:hypothetical protein
MRPLNYSADFQGVLGQRRSGVICSKGRAGMIELLVWHTWVD